METPAHIENKGIRYEKSRVQADVYICESCLTQMRIIEIDTHVCNRFWESVPDVPAPDALEINETPITPNEAIDALCTGITSAVLWGRKFVDGKLLLRSLQVTPIPPAQDEVEHTVYDLLVTLANHYIAYQEAQRIAAERIEAQRSENDAGTDA